MNQSDSTLSKEHGDYCAYIRRLSDERLDLLISTPPLGQDLLEHAAFCDECGARLEAILNRSNEQFFASLPPESKTRLNNWAADFVKRNFPHARSVTKIDAARNEQDRVSKRPPAPAAPQKHRGVPLKLAAAPPSQKVTRQSEPRLFGTFYVEGQAFELLELSSPDGLSILLRGPVPGGATRVWFGPDSAQLSWLESGICEIQGISSIDISDYLRHLRDGSPEYPPLRFDTDPSR